MISVIIPVYNVEDYLHVCLNSVLKQSYQNFEIICIDDASTDSSLDILEYFSIKDSRIKILKNKSNQGPGLCRNKGLDIAEGEYIFFLDGDDWISLNTFELLIKKVKNDDSDFIMFKNMVFYQENKKFGLESYYEMEFMEEFESKVFNHFDLDKTALFKIPNGPVNKLYLKSFLDEKNIRFPNDNIIHEDNPFFYKAIISAEKISLINNHLYIRRRRAGSITASNDKRIFNNIDVCYLILDVFMEFNLYIYYKKELLNYIFLVKLNSKYNQIDEKYKQNFFNEVLKVFDNFYKEYGLKEDIIKNVDQNMLKRFNQL